MEILFTIICMILLAFIISSVLYSNYGTCKWLFHDLLHWHEPNGNVSLNGINLKSRCKYCGKEIIQDSQGNWF